MESGIAIRAALVAGALGLAGAVSADSFVVSGARIADGTGGTVRRADVRVDGDRIVAVGRLKPRRGERVIRAEGLVLAPGFIDIHNHSTKGLVSDPLAETQVSQGITTLAVGADGASPWPLSDYLAERRLAPAAVNVLAFVGHATVRKLVLGEDYKRAATPEEISRMADLVARGMREGAAGLSSGLEYEVGSYSTTEELVAMARAASHGGIYMSHIRDEADESFKAFAEALEIGRRAGIPVQISHIKLGTVGVWGQAGKAVDLFARARARGQDVTADCYPYEAWHANIEVLVPNKKYDDPASIEKALADVGGASRVTITACKAHPEYVNRNLDEIAREQSVSPVEIFRRIVRDGSADVIGHSMKAEDVAVFLRQPWVMIASDGGINSEHPRGAGTFPRVLGRYVREQRLFSLAEAIRKMTLLPARRLGLSDRGRIAPGLKADLVLFDPATVLDQSTFAEPQRLSVGIRAVWVNGLQVWSGEKSTGATPGRVLSKEAPPESSTPRQRLDAVFQAYAGPDSPGCAVAVVRDGRVEQERGYGMASLEHGVPITPDTVFDIGSAAKQFAAASVLLLAQDRKLSLDDDVRRYVPELPDFGTPIRLVDLLHHTSGLRDYTELLSLAGARSEDLTTDRDALDILSRQKGLDFPPGTAYRYSNSGYFLLSIVVRRVTGKPLRDFARERIFGPLGMTGTQYMEEHSRIILRRATGYAKRGEAGFRVAMSDWEQNGDGGLQTTVRDLALWDRNFEKPVVGGEAMVAALTRPGTLLGGKPMDYALGLRIDSDRGLKRIRHGGSWVGYRAEFLRYPDRRLSVIVLCNLRSAAPSRLARAVAQIYLPELAAAAEGDRPERPAEGETPPPAVSASAFAGLYWNADRFETRRIRESGGKLFYATEPGEETALLPIAPGRFRARGSSLEVRLTSEGAAGSSAIVVEQGADEPPATWKMVSAAATIPATGLASYRGSYTSDELDATYRIGFEKDQLVLNRRGADPTALDPLFRDAFHAAGLGVVFFDRVASGAVGGFRIAIGPSRLAFAKSQP